MRPAIRELAVTLQREFERAAACAACLLRPAPMGLRRSCVVFGRSAGANMPDGYRKPRAALWDCRQIYPSREVVRLHGRSRAPALEPAVSPSVDRGSRTACSHCQRCPKTVRNGCQQGASELLFAREHRRLSRSFRLPTPFARQRACDHTYRKQDQSSEQVLLVRKLKREYRWDEEEVEAEQAQYGARDRGMPRQVGRCDHDA